MMNLNDLAHRLGWTHGLKSVDRSAANEEKATNLEEFQTNIRDPLQLMLGRLTAARATLTLRSPDMTQEDIESIFGETYRNLNIAEAAMASMTEVVSGFKWNLHDGLYGKDEEEEEDAQEKRRDVEDPVPGIDFDHFFDRVFGNGSHNDSRHEYLADLIAKKEAQKTQVENVYRNLTEYLNSTSASTDFFDLRMEVKSQLEASSQSMGNKSLDSYREFADGDRRPARNYEQLVDGINGIFPDILVHMSNALEALRKPDFADTDAGFFDHYFEYVAPELEEAKGQAGDLAVLVSHPIRHPVITYCGYACRVQSGESLEKLSKLLGESPKILSGHGSESQNVKRYDPREELKYLLDG